MICLGEKVSSLASQRRRRTINLALMRLHPVVLVAPAEFGARTHPYFTSIEHDVA